MERKLSLFTENGDLTDNKMIQGMFLGRLGLSCEDMNKVLNGEKVLSELVKGTEVKEVEVIKEVPVEKIKEVVKEVPVEVEVEKIVEKFVNVPITAESIIDYINTGSTDVCKILSVLRQKDVTLDKPEGKTLDDFDMCDIGIHVLRNGSKTFLYKLYDKIGDLLKHSNARAIASTDILSIDRVNKIIDSNTNSDKAKKYLVRFVQRDKSVPVSEFARTLTYLPTADIRNSRSMSDIDRFYKAVTDILGHARDAKDSSIMLMIDFALAVKSSDVNILGQKHSITHIGKYDNPATTFAKLLKRRIESSKVKIPANYINDATYAAKRGTFLTALSGIIGVDVVLEIIKSMGFENVTPNTLVDRLFVLNWSNYKSRKAILATNNALFTDCSNLFINGYSIYDYYINFIKELFQRVTDVQMSELLRCLTNYKIVSKISMTCQSAIRDICKDAFDQNDKLYGGSKILTYSARSTSRYNDWKVAKDVVNPMVAMNMFIPSVELSNVFKCSTGDIMSACKNIDHKLNQSDNWVYGTIIRLTKICVKYHVNIMHILPLYGERISASTIKSIKTYFYRNIKDSELS